MNCTSYKFYVATEIWAI